MFNFVERIGFSSNQKIERSKFNHGFNQNELMIGGMKKEEKKKKEEKVPKLKKLCLSSTKICIKELAEFYLKEEEKTVEITEEDIRDAVQKAQRRVNAGQYRKGVSICRRGYSKTEEECIGEKIGLNPNCIWINQKYKMDLEGRDEVVIHNGYCKKLRGKKKPTPTPSPTEETPDEDDSSEDEEEEGEDMLSRFKRKVKDNLRKKEVAAKNEDIPSRLKRAKEEKNSQRTSTTVEKVIDHSPDQDMDDLLQIFGVGQRDKIYGFYYLKQMHECRKILEGKNSFYKNAYLNPIYYEYFRSFIRSNPIYSQRWLIPVVNDDKKVYTILNEKAVKNEGISLRNYYPKTDNPLGQQGEDEKMMDLLKSNSRICLDPYHPHHLADMDQARNFDNPFTIDKTRLEIDMVKDSRGAQLQAQVQYSAFKYYPVIGSNCEPFNLDDIDDQGFNVLTNQQYDRSSQNYGIDVFRFYQLRSETQELKLRPKLRHADGNLYQTLNILSRRARKSMIQPTIEGLKRSLISASEKLIIEGFVRVPLNYRWDKWNGKIIRGIPSFFTAFSFKIV